MYWSAALSLKTSRDAQHLANYGSFGTSSNSSSTSSSRSCSRSSSGSNIRIPQSIPEHQCILQFAEPRLQHYEEEKLAEYYEMEQAANYANSYNDNAATTTVTVTASKTLQMLLLSSQKLEEFVKSGTSSTTNATASTRSSSYTNKNGFSYTNAYSNDHHHHQQQHSSSHNPDVFSYLNGSFASETTSLIGAARAAGEDDDHEQVNYWVLERERLRAKRERRILTSLFKKTAAHADDEPTSAWRTGAIMCSVPLVLIILFVIFILVTGGESGDAAAVGASASSAWGIVVRTVAGASGSRSAAALRGSV